MLTHKEKLERIIEQLKKHDPAKPVSLNKKSVSHEVPKPTDQKFSDEKIDISDLDEIIEINEKEQTCTAEPGVTFVDLVEKTLKHNLVPFVVPELKTITIGGAVAGCSIESMSYKYGGFHDSCIEYEVLTAKGEVIHCSRKTNSLIFEMMHGTFGTLGIITKLKFNLIPAKEFVKVVYEKYDNLEDYKESIWKHYKEKDVDFMDGIIHSPTEYVLSIANFSDTAPYTNNYDWMKIYYLSTKERKEDYLKTEDYFFRYNKGVTNANPKSFLGRLIFGKFVDSNTVLKLAKRFHKFIPSIKIPITLDTFIPFSKINEFMNWYEKEVNHFPLWCVPYKLVHEYEWISKKLLSKTKDRFFLDIAIYGMKKDKTKNYYRLIEEELMRIGGMKTLISTNCYSKDEFWNLWNKENYQKVKKKTDPDNIFRDLYEKTCNIAKV